MSQPYDDIDIKVRTDAESVEAVFQKLQPVLAVSALLAFPIAWVLRDEVPATLLVCWVLQLTCISGFRYLSIRRYRADTARDQHPDRWIRELAIGFAAAGFAWSQLGTVLAPATEAWTSTLLGVVISGVAGIGLMSTGTLQVAYRAFVLWLMVPVVVWKLWFGGPAELSLAMLAVLLTGVLLVVNRRAALVWRAMVRSRVTADRLTGELAAARRQLRENNAILHGEVKERTRAQTRARSATDRLRLALARAGMHTWEYDIATDDVRVTGAPALNLPTALRSLGSLHDLAALVHLDDAERLRHAVQSARAVGDVLRCEFRLRVGGEWRWMSSRGRVIAAEDGSVRTIGVTQDMHRRRQVREELIQAKHEALAAKKASSDLLEHLRAEIRTPLIGALSVLQRLHATTLDAEQRPLVQAVNKSTGAMLTVLDRILEPPALDVITTESSVVLTRFAEPAS